MVQTSVRINGLKEVSSFMNKMPKSINREIKQKGILELAKSLQRRIKYRAPVGSTGWLRRSVMIEKQKSWVSVVVNAFYALSVEYGRGPNASGNYFIPLEYFQQHATIPEAPGNYVSNPVSFVDLRGSLAIRPRPFIEPSFRSWVPKIEGLLQNQLNKAITQASKR